jgi:tryptophan synthase alpha chain
MTAPNAVSHAILHPRHGIGLVAYVMAGFPRREGFVDLLDRVAEVADVVEIGVPFSDPMADGVTLQDASRVALQGGATLRWLLETLGSRSHPTPTLLMSYLNPLLAVGPALADLAAHGGIAGFIVPDLPLEESAPFTHLGLVQLVAPATPPARRRLLAEATRGFLYAVTANGVTGGTVPTDVGAMLDDLRAVSPVPVCAGFGIRSAKDVARLRPHADGVIVGSALVDAIGRGADPGRFLSSLLES